MQIRRPSLDNFYKLFFSSRQHVNSLKTRMERTTVVRDRPAIALADSHSIT